MGSPSLSVHHALNQDRIDAVQAIIDSCLAINLSVPEDLKMELSELKYSPSEIRLTQDAEDSTDMADVYRLYVGNIPKGSDYVLIKLSY